MRIIGGALKGRKLLLPKKVKTRPTTDFAREGLFNLLENRYDIEGATVYDFFCGLGSISFEFVSRGADEVVAIDVSQTSRQFIVNAAKEFEVSDKLRVVKADFFKVIKVFDQQADFIFADPPFTSTRYSEIITTVLSKNILKKNGVFIIEHPKNVEVSNLEGYKETRSYGNVRFSFFK